MPTPKAVLRRRRIKALIGLLAFALLGAVLARLYQIHLARITPPVAERIPIEPTAPVAPSAPIEKAAPSEPGVTASAEETALLELVNRERGKAGLEPLKFSARLTAVARDHSHDMATRNYFSHGGPDGDGPADRIRAAGLVYNNIGENIYMEKFPDLAGMPERAVKGWLASPRHRENMLSPVFRDSGIGVARSADGETYVTQDFLR